MPPGFTREQLRARYDISSIQEDDWHAYTGCRTQQLLDRLLASKGSNCRILNAGAGIYKVARQSEIEICVDLFTKPLSQHQTSVCASVEALPFLSKSFDVIVCVGEVLAYCDPARAIAEFDRVLADGGLLICDFGNSRSFRYWFRKPFGHAAFQIEEEYNGAPERTWVYAPNYIFSLLTSKGLRIKNVHGIHIWSSLARLIGFAPANGLRLQRTFENWTHASQYADIITVVAEKVRASSR